MDTSHLHGNKISVLNKRTKMAFSISSLCAFFEGEVKSISRGENNLVATQRDVKLNSSIEQPRFDCSNQCYYRF